MEILFSPTKVKHHAEVMLAGTTVNSREQEPFWDEIGTAESPLSRELSMNLVQIGSMVQDNKHGDTWKDGHGGPIIFYLHMCKWAKKRNKNTFTVVICTPAEDNLRCFMSAVLPVETKKMQPFHCRKLVSKNK